MFRAHVLTSDQMAPTKSTKTSSSKKSSAKSTGVKKTGTRKAPRTAYRNVFLGYKNKTSGGLDASDIKKNKNGRLVSKVKSASAKQHPWAKAVKQAHKELIKEGVIKTHKKGGKTVAEFVPLSSKASASPASKAFYQRAKGIYAKSK